MRLFSLLFLALVLFPVTVSAQKVEVLNSYKFKTSIPDGFFEDLGAPAKKGHKVETLRIDSINDVVYYKYWPFSKDSPSDSLYGGKVFSLSTRDFAQFTEPLYKRYKGAGVGAYSVPFRLRGIGGEFDFESSLSLQSNLVFGWGSINQQES